MGAIIFNISEAAKLSAFNIYQEPIKMLLENEKEAFEKQSFLSKIYHQKIKKQDFDSNLLKTKPCFWDKQSSNHYESCLKDVMKIINVIFR